MLYMAQNVRLRVGCAQNALYGIKLASRLYTLPSIGPLIGPIKIYVLH